MQTRRAALSSCCRGGATGSLSGVLVSRTRLINRGKSPDLWQVEHLPLQSTTHCDVYLRKDRETYEIVHL